MAKHGSDRWKDFFSAMADGLLPYLHLYVKRNMRGGGLGNFVASRRRYQVPVVVDGSALLGRGTYSTSGSNSLKLVTPTQQTVEQAKSAMRQEEDISFRDLTSAIKGKTTGISYQSKKKRPSAKTVLSKTKKSLKRKKKPSSKTKPKKHHYQDIYS